MSGFTAMADGNFALAEAYQIRHRSADAAICQSKFTVLLVGWRKRRAVSL